MTSIFNSTWLHPSCEKSITGGLVQKYLPLRRSTLKFSNPVIAKYFLLIILLATVLPLIYSALPVGRDWQNTYRPAALAVLDGQSPYSVEIYYAAPWAAWFLAPFAILPYGLGRLLTFILALAAFAFVAWRAGAKPAAMVIFLCSAAVVGCLNNGNIEWMPLLGLCAPPWLGLILLAVKPQVGIGLGIYWLIRIWREKGFRQVVITFAPLAVLLLISFLLYGLWPLRFNQTLAWSVDNTALGVQSLFVGGVLLVRSLRTQDDRMALAAGPFLAPYVLQFTWSACLVWLLNHPWELLAAVVGLWIPVIIRVFS